jgi:hypothetical protein
MCVVDEEVQQQREKKLRLDAWSLKPAKFTEWGMTQQRKP